ncbi:MAG: hypothetical protein AAFY17_10635 [Cyanobacteria bacterium J06642_11]
MKPSELRPIEQENLENLERILQGIWSGRLSHDQQAFYISTDECGTAACVAGWYALEYGDNKGMSADEVERSWRESSWFRSESSSIPASRPYKFATEDIGLTASEAELIFSSDATKAIHQLCLAAFKQGRRLDLDRFMSADEDFCFFDISTEELYAEYDRECEICISDELEDRVSVEDFDLITLELNQFLSPSIKKPRYRHAIGMAAKGVE